MINPAIPSLFGRYRPSSPDNFFSVRDMINNVYIERKLRFWRLRISARQSGILQAKVEFNEIPIQVKNVIFVNLHKNIEIFTLRSNQLRQNYLGGVQNLKNWFPRFFSVYGGFSRFLEVLCLKPTSKKCENRPKNRFSQNRS